MIKKVVIYLNKNSRYYLMIFNDDGIIRTMSKTNSLEKIIEQFQRCNTEVIVKE